jgi:hypothetical protein
MSSQYPSVHTNKNILSVYTEGITMGKNEWKKAKKYDDVSFLQTELPMNFNLSIKFICNI